MPCVDFPEPEIDLADTGFGTSGVGGTTVGGDAATTAIGTAGGVTTPIGLASVDGISMVGDATAVVTVEVVTVGSGNVYDGVWVGGVVCAKVTMVVLATVCECVRDRTPRLTCAGGKPKLYSTISSSKRFRLIERDEL